LKSVTEQHMTRGIYRTRIEESGACYVLVEYETPATMEVPEQRYRERGYKPEFDKLPWKRDYDPAKAATESKKSK
jgi:hypothetical protein